MNCRPFLILVFNLILLATAGLYGRLHASVPHVDFGDPESFAVYNSTIDFKHYYYETDDKYFLTKLDTNKTVTSTYKTIVMENRWTKLTLLPEFGGRIISLIYKPTKHEQLFQNPVGITYGINEGNFYYDYLMVYGGIFPTFPEPEHGKAWNRSWKTEIHELSKDKISVRMTFVDDIEKDPRVPKKFKLGKTGLILTTTVTLYKDRAPVEIDYKITNPNNYDVSYEYWTCTTLCPGSEIGKTECGSETEMIVPVKFVKFADWSRPQLSRVEKAADNERDIYVFDKLTWFKNWPDMGIAYAYPRVMENWWGVINHNEQEGILRISDNVNATPGVKLWTWGYDNSLRTVSNSNYSQPHRPYVEPWAGHGVEFFKPIKIAAKSSKEWTEYYYTFVGMDTVTFANEHGTVSIEPDDKGNSIIVKAFMTKPKARYGIRIMSKNEKVSKILTDAHFISNSKKANEWRFHLGPDKRPQSGDISVEISDEAGVIMTAPARY